MNVGNEANAVAMDEMIKNDIKPVISAAPGFLEAKRTVCKSEWAYECFFVFDGLDNFKAWKESDAYKSVMEKSPDNFNKLGMKIEDAYNGARVYDTI